MNYITEALNQAIKDKKILRLKIMLKDSLVLDPTGAGFDNMYSHIKKNGIDLYENFDNGYLEKDPTKWTENLLNDELVNIIDNFSLERVNYLKQVIKYVLGKKNLSAKTESTPINSKYTSGINTYKSNAGLTKHITKNDNNEKNMLETNIMDDIKKLRKYLVDHNAKGYWDIVALNNIFKISSEIKKNANLLRLKFEKK